LVVAVAAVAVLANESATEANASNVQVIVNSPGE
jgi:hypothetical protein